MSAEEMRFWDWAVDAYDRNSVSDSLIELQEQTNADICVILWCVWCASTGKRVSGDEMSAALEIVAPWNNNVVRPLRAARRFLKNADLAAADIYDAAKNQELHAEKIEMAALQKFADDNLSRIADTDQSALAAQNLRAYARCTSKLASGQPLSENDVKMICKLLPVDSISRTDQRETP